MTAIESRVGSRLLDKYPSLSYSCVLYNITLISYLLLYDDRFLAPLTLTTGHTDVPVSKE